MAIIDDVILEVQDGFDAPEQESEEQRNERLARLDAFAEELVRSRSEAIAYRRRLNIDLEWVEDLEHHEGIDDANRHEVARGTWADKPAGQAMLPAGESTKSTIFINITRPYCDMAEARIVDMLQPVDDRAWAIDPTPRPDLIELAAGRAPHSIKAAVRKSLGNDPDKVMGELKTLAETAERQMAIAKERARLAQDQIDDWLKDPDCRFHAEFRKVIANAVRTGTGVIKGPVPVFRKLTAYVNGELVEKTEIAPTSYSINPINCYPAPECGNDIHRGSCFWERDDLSERRLRELMETEGYLSDQIEKCLTEGPMKAVAEYQTGSSRPGMVVSDAKHSYDIWYYYGMATIEAVRAMGIDVEEKDANKVFFDVALEMVNGHVIKGAINPSKSGKYPYDFLVYQQREGMPWGQGVSRQIRTPQRVVKAAGRNMMDNAGVAGGGMFVIDDSVEPKDGRWTIAPRKVWIRRGVMDGTQPTGQGIAVVKVDMLQAELQAIIELGMKLAEDVTGLPMLMQGQMSKAPDTLGGMQMLYNNASASLRRIARIFDDSTESHIGRYYDWIMEYGEDDEMKGDFKVVARGSSALVDRDLQNTMIQQMAAIVENPIFGADPKKWFREFLVSTKLDPKRILYDDPEWQKVVQQLAEQARQPSNAAEAAQIRAQSAEKIAQLNNDHKAEQADKQRAFEAANAQIEAALNQMEASGSRSTEIAKIRSRMSELMMKLGVQVQLSREQQAGDHVREHNSDVRKAVLTPPAEPAGRAQPGKSFEQ